MPCAHPQASLEVPVQKIIQIAVTSEGNGTSRGTALYALDDEGQIFVYRPLPGGRGNSWTAVPRLFSNMSRGTDPNRQ